MSRPWAERLVYLSNLEEGWLDGQGIPSRPEATQAVESLLFTLFTKDEEYLKSRPGIFPQEEGGITVEWYISNQLISIEIMGWDYDETYAFFEMSSDGKEWSHLDTDSLEEIITRMKQTVLFNPKDTCNAPA